MIGSAALFQLSTSMDRSRLECTKIKGGSQCNKSTLGLRITWVIDKHRRKETTNIDGDTVEQGKQWVISDVFLGMKNGLYRE